MSRPFKTSAAALLVLGLAGCDQKSPSSPQASAKLICTSMSMRNPSTGVPTKMPTSGGLLEIPGELRLEGEMSGAAVVLEFVRPSYGPLRCHYQQNASAALAFDRCDPADGRAGDLVTTDSFRLQMAEGAGPVAADVTVVACARQAEGPPPSPPMDIPPGFRRLPNGEVVGPEGVTEPVTSGRVPFGLTGEIEREYRTIAEGNATARAALGSGRLAFSYIEAINPPKGQARDSVHAKLWYFSYALNAAVVVTVKNGAVVSAERSDAWPPEGKSEVDEAVALAKTHPGLQGKVNDLEGGAMLAQVERGRPPWAGNRVLDVRFFDASRVSQYMATVDLTTQRVLRAGPATG
jgi:hypothetical protein